MQFGSCISRAIASFGTLTATALIASTGFAGVDNPLAGAAPKPVASTDAPDAAANIATDQDRFFYGDRASLSDLTGLDLKGTTSAMPNAFRGIQAPCLPGDMLAPEPCVNGPADQTDGGCGADPVNPPFSPLMLNTAVCGNLSVFPTGAPTTRDIDWYILDLSGETTDTNVTVSYTGGNYTSLFGLIAFGGTTDNPEFDFTGRTCADDLGFVFAFGDAADVTPDPNTTVTGTAQLAPGQYIFLALQDDFPDGFSDECGVNDVRYRIEITGVPAVPTGCCLPDGSCADLTPLDCTNAGGFVQDADCATVGSCIGFCCLLDGTLSSPVTNDQCDTLVTNGTARGFRGYNLDAQEQMDAFCPVTPNNISCAAADPIATDGTVTVSFPKAGLTPVSEDPSAPGLLCGGVDFLYTPEVGLWYTFTGTGNTVTVSTCDIASEIGSALYVFCGVDDLMAMPPTTACDNLRCVAGADQDADVCADSATGFSNDLTFCTESGTQYYILLASAFGETGNIGLSVTDSGTPCMDATGCALVPVECPAGAFTELNEDCTTPPGVEGNDGCTGGTGTSFFAEDLFLDPGDASELICGNIGARPTDTGATADTDWFVLLQDSNAQTVTRITVASEANVTVNLYNYANGSSDAFAGANCDNITGALLGQATTGSGQAPAVIELCLPEGEWFVQINGDFEAEACIDDRYTIIAEDLGSCTTGACCLGDGTCSVVTLPECVDLGGVNWEEGADCVSFSCLGACCALAANPGDANTCSTVTFDDCVADPNSIDFTFNTDCMSFDCGIRPANDECDGAIALAVDGSTTSIDLSGAAPVNGDLAVFYSFVGTGNSVTISLCGSVADADDADGILDSILSIFCRGCDADQSFIGTIDDTCPDGLGAEATLCTEAGTEYLIEVGLFDFAQSGTLNLTLTDDATPCTTAPDCSPLGACCLDPMTNECVETTQDDCENNLMGCFLEGQSCGNVVTVQADTPFTPLGGAALPQVAVGNFAAIDDEAVAIINMPFAFTLFNTTYPAGTPLYINVNGFVTFDDITADTTTDFYLDAPFPQTVVNNMITSVWADYITNATPAAGIRAATTANSLIIEWTVSVFGQTPPVEARYQLILNDDSTWQVLTADLLLPEGARSAGAQGADNTEFIDFNAQIDFQSTFSVDLNATPTGVCPTMACDGGMTGACCIDGNCSELSEADCLSMGGEYGGDGTTCADVSCNDCPADFDNDGDVDFGDFGAFVAAFDSVAGDANYLPAADFDNDGDVDFGDFGSFVTQFDRFDCYQLTLLP